MGLRELLHRTGSSRKPERVTAEVVPDDPVEAHRQGKLSFEAAVGRITGKSSSEFIVFPSTGAWLPNFGFTSNNLDQSIAASTWAYSCIVSNARAASELPPIVQTRSPGGPWERNATHELNRLIDVPLGGAPRWPAWGWKQLTQVGIMQRYAIGNNYLMPAVDGDRLLALFPIMKPGSVKAIENPSDGLLDGWDLGAGRGRLPLDGLVNIMSPTAGSLWDGISPLGVAEEAATVDAIASARQRAAAQNRAAPGLIVVIDDIWGQGLSEDQENAALEKLRDRYTDAADSGKPIIFSKGTEIHDPPSQSVGDLAIYDARRFSRDEILAVIGTPPPMVGIYENATLQNFDNAFRVWWMDVLFPLLGETYHGINSQAIWPRYGQNVRLWYDPARSDIGVLLQSAKLDVAKKIRDLGYTANDATREAGLDMAFVKELQVYNTDLARAGRDGGAEEGSEAA